MHAHSSLIPSSILCTPVLNSQCSTEFWRAPLPRAGSNPALPGGFLGGQQPRTRRRPLRPCQPGLRSGNYISAASPQPGSVLGHGTAVVPPRPALPPVSCSPGGAVMCQCAREAPSRQARSRAPGPRHTHGLRHPQLQLLHRAWATGGGRECGQVTPGSRSAHSTLNRMYNSIASWLQNKSVPPSKAGCETLKETGQGSCWLVVDPWGQPCLIPAL